MKFIALFKTICDRWPRVSRFKEDAASIYLKIILRNWVADLLVNSPSCIRQLVDHIHLLNLTFNINRKFIQIITISSQFLYIFSKNIIKWIVVFIGKNGYCWLLYSISLSDQFVPNFLILFILTFLNSFIHVRDCFCTILRNIDHLVLQSTLIVQWHFNILNFYSWFALLGEHILLNLAIFNVILTVLSPTLSTNKLHRESSPA